MNKEKFHIPMPDDITVQSEINTIVSLSMQGEKSFFHYVQTMYRQVGLRYLLSDGAGHVYLLLVILTLVGFVMMSPEPPHAEAVDLYAFIFLTSPLLFLALSMCTFAHKVRNGTYEVEMACKYNVYQMTALRMLVFSIVSILINAMTILSMVIVHNDVHFVRAFMISLTALFTFSIIFLYAMVKRQSGVVATGIAVGWILGNQLLRFFYSSLYTDLLIQMPLVVHATVLIGSLYGYIHYLHRLLHIQFTEGEGSYDRREGRE